MLVSWIHDSYYYWLLMSESSFYIIIRAHLPSQFMVKSLASENLSFIILLTSIFIFFIFGEIRNLTSLCLLNNNGFSLSYFFSLSLTILWIGVQFPQEKFLSFGRILTLHYYFVLMCILLKSFLSSSKFSYV